MLKSYKCFYICNCLMDVFSGILQWFTNYYFTDFKMVIMGGYEEAIKKFQDHTQKGKLVERLPLPAISMNPLGDLTIDPKFPQLWRARDIGENLQDLYLEPEYEDEEISFTVIANRFTGNFEIIIYVQSIYEYLDHYVQCLMFFHGGLSRRVRPGLIMTNLIVPDELFSYKQNYNWARPGLLKKFVRVLNEEKFVYPMILGPQIWLASLTNASTVYGDGGVPFYKLQLVVEYDVEIPTHIVVRENDRIREWNIKLMTNDPVLLPKVGIHENNNYQIVIDYEHFKNIPSNILGPEPYFKKLTLQEYMFYMFAPETFMKICRGIKTYKHIATFQYIFKSDVRKEDNFTINLADYVPNFTIDSYDEIIIGDRKGMLAQGTAYEVDIRNTRQKILVKMDVTKDTTWDILIYKPE